MSSSTRSAAVASVLGPEYVGMPGAEELVAEFFAENHRSIDDFGKDSMRRHHGSQKSLDSKEHYTK